MVAGVVAAACAIGFGGFVAGEHHQRPVTVMSGRAYAVGDEATIMVGDRNVAGFMDGVKWLDHGGGTLHEGGWPACLAQQDRAVPVKFAEEMVTGPGGHMSWPEVLWVECP